MLAVRGHGLSIEDIDWSSPSDMDPYLKSYRIEKNERDIFQWQMGQYMAAAVSCAFPKGKYPKKPMFQLKENSKDITERDIQMAILAEQQYIALAINKGLPETIIK